MLPCQQPEVIAYSLRIAESFAHWTGRTLIEAQDSAEKLAHALYHAPFVLLSHGIQTDPLFRYANLAAQTLWEMPWETFIGLPSRLSAEPDARGERERLLARAQKNGYVDDYQGVRVTQSGKRFRIRDTILWNVVDAKGERIGQAATFTRWEWL